MSTVPAYEPDDDTPYWHAWRRRAACRDLDTSVFFPNGETGEALTDAEAAKEICAGCPVRLDCLEFAMATNQAYGIFGGLTESERRSLRRRRARQRARGDEDVAQAS